MSEKAVTIRLPGPVYQAAHDLAAITGASIKELVVVGLQKEMEHRTKDRAELQAVLRSIQNVREKHQL